MMALKLALVKPAKICGRPAHHLEIADQEVGILQVKRCSEGCLPPIAGAASGIVGQDPRGMAVNAYKDVNDEIMPQLSPALLAGHCPKPLLPPTLSCERLKEGGSKHFGKT